MIKTGCISDNQGMRDYMEDRSTWAKLDLGSNGNAYFFGVYDGHGGQQTAIVLKELLHLLLQKRLRNINVHESEILYQTITDAYHELDKCMFDNGITDGSTATVALYIVNHNVLHLINTGDSRIAVWDGQKIIQTIDHKPLDEKERIEKAGGIVLYFGIPRVNGVLAVSRAFGDFSLKKRNNIFVNDGPVIVTPDITTIRIKSSEYKILLASDGLWDVVDTSIIKNISTNPCTDLISTALSNGSSDNITIIYILLSGKITT